MKSLAICLSLLLLTGDLLVAGTDPTETARSARQVAKIHMSRGDQAYFQSEFGPARVEYEAALQIFEELDDDLGVADSLDAIGQLDLDLFRLNEAKKLFQRALALRENSLPSRIHRDIAESHLNLGTTHFASGEFDQARTHYETAIEIGARTLGENHPDLAIAKRSLGQLSAMQGRDAEAEGLYREALGILEASPSHGKSHWKTAEARVVLAKHLVFEGDLATARALLEASLGILEVTPGPYHLSTIGTQLATCTTARLQGDLQRAGQLTLQMRSAIGRVIPDDHPLSAEILHEDALVMQSQGNGRDAEAKLRAALEIMHRRYGSGHPNTIRALRDFAVLQHALERPSKAARLFDEVYARAQRVLPEDSPEMASLLQDRSIFLLESGHTDAALDSLQQSLAAQDSIIESLLAGNSERETRLLFGQHYLDLTVSAHFLIEGVSVRSGKLALETVLRRKGLGLDVTLRGHQLLDDRDSRHSELLSRLKALRDEQLRLWMGLPREFDHRVRRLAKLRQEIDVQQRSLHPDLKLPPTVLGASVEGVQERLQAGQALLEFVNYAEVESGYLLNPKRIAKSRYAVAVLTSEGRPEWVDLGPASELDELVIAYRKSLLPGRGGHREAGQALYLRTLARIESHLRGIDKLDVSPAGSLDFVPWPALIDRHGRNLAERFSINILASGRDLLRENETDARSRGAVLVGGLDYGRGVDEELATTVDQNELISLPYFSPLRGAASEVAAIQKVLGPGQSRVLSGLEAQESEIDQIRAPAVIHFATHGFFQPEKNMEATIRDSSYWRRFDSFVDPLIRSGLALSQANAWRRAQTADDGILTALELRDLDLSGTRLAVLSACETGLGEGSYNQGLYGMRRALSIAGAESQVLSLWPISDQVTREFMVSFYAQLKAGTDRTEALRQTQLAFSRGQPLPVTGVLLQRGAEAVGGEGLLTSHPYYWAGFVISGARGPVWEAVPDD